MKTTFLLGLVMTLCFTLIGCGFNKDAEIKVFITEFDSVTKEVVQKIEANPSAAGIDEAQKAFDAKKASLREKFDGFKNATNLQVSADTKKALEESVKKNMGDLTSAMTKNMMKIATDKGASDKLKKLMEDYGNTFKM
jgi:hypothetical protein